MTSNDDAYRVTCAVDDCGFEEAYDSGETAWDAASEHARAAGGDHIGVIKSPVAPGTDADGTPGAEAGPDPLPAGSLITQSRNIIGPEDIDLDVDPEDVDALSEQDIQELLEAVEAEVEAAIADDRGDGDGGAG